MATVTATATITATPSRTPPRTPTATATGTSTPVPPLPRILGLQRASVTSSSATITWTTNVPTTSQVEFGTTPSFGLSTGIDTALTTAHSVVVRGLTPGALYFFRARSMDAAENLVISANNSFTTTPRGRPPAIGDVGARRVTATTALIEWNATNSVAQVEFGIVPTLGRFTLLRPYAATAQDMLLTGLRPKTQYFYRVKTWGPTGDVVVSETFSFTTAPAEVAMLLGKRELLPTSEILAIGQVRAYQFAAHASGLASAVPVYVDAANTATSLTVGLYTDRGGKPSALLSQATLSRLTPGAWNRVLLRPTSLVQGDTYWLAVLNPTGGSGTLALRAGIGPNASLLSGPRIHSTLPAHWVSEVAPRPGAVSAYVQQLVPAVTITGPADGASIGGNLAVDVSVDGDAPVRSVELLVDGRPVGEVDRTPPFQVVWNSTNASTHDFHVLTARVTDSVGKTGTSAPVQVHVDNGAMISQVATSAVTSTSAWVSWSTDAVTDAQVEFGTTTAYGRSTVLGPGRGWQHQQLLTALVPATTYHYRVRSRDQRGVLSISEARTFRTLPAAFDAP